MVVGLGILLCGLGGFLLATDLLQDRASVVAPLGLFIFTAGAVLVEVGWL